MIPILYAGTEQSFLNNGLGRLADAISCKVTEERNGVFELEMTYPITGIHYSDIAENCIIWAKTEDGGNNQAFIIYKISRPINGIVTIYAQHISYLLNGFVVMPFSANNISAVMAAIPNYAVLTIPFTFQTDITSTVPFNLESPRTIRGLLGGESGSILDVYGGYDYKFDNFNVQLLQNRGADRGVTIRYGKNMTSLKKASDMTNVYTGIVPFWASEGNAVYLPEKVVYSSYASYYPYKIIKVVDFSSEWETAPTEQQLRDKAESYINNNKGWNIKNNIDVSFVNLAQTEEYKNIAPLERVKLCDTVTVQYDALGVNVKTKVIKTVYNVLLERYDTITLGDTTYTLAQAIQSAIDAPSLAEVRNYTKSAVERATKLIQGGLGGHVVFNTDGNGEPQEILIMDTDDIDTAVNVIRMNLNGIGFSTNGYQGPFANAWTIDGNLVADFITTGNLNGALITAGSVQANALSVGAREELNVIHNYLSEDIFTDISVWNYGNIAPTFETIDGKTYLVLDGTSLNAWDTNCYVNTATDAMGATELNIHVKYHIDRDATIPSSQKFRFFNYKDTNGISHQRSVSLTAQTIPANVNYTIDNTWTIAEEVDYSKEVPKFGFYFIQGTKMYIEELTITCSQAEYTSTALVFNADGLSSTVEKNGVISAINQSAEQITISAAKLDLNGDLSLQGDFTSYDENDNTTYAHLTSAAIEFFNNGANVFNISSIPLLGNNAGIFFGDVEDPSSMADHTYITQDIVHSPLFYSRSSGSALSVSQYFCQILEGKFYQYQNGSLNAMCDGTQNVIESPIQCNSIVAEQLFLNNRSGSAHSIINTPITFMGNVYNSGGSVVFVSDKRKKKNIKDLVIDKAKSFIMGLKPRAFKFIKDISTSNRYHHGFIAQEVKEAMGEDWGLYVEDEKTDFIGLRYDELLADMVAVIQDQEKRIDALERRLNDLTDNQP